TNSTTASSTTCGAERSETIPVSVRITKIFPHNSAVSVVYCGLVCDRVYCSTAGYKTDLTGCFCPYRGEPEVCIKTGGHCNHTACCRGEVYRITPIRILNCIRSRVLCPRGER